MIEATRKARAGDNGLSIIAELGRRSISRKSTVYPAASRVVTRATDPIFERRGA
jgi:hypothetical protein